MRKKCAKLRIRAKMVKIMKVFMSKTSSDLCANTFMILKKTPETQFCAILRNSVFYNNFSYNLLDHTLHLRQVIGLL